MGGSVRSEVGRLVTVLVHRPDLELRRLTPTNMDELLFDELVWVDRARAEHDAFTAVLQDAGAEVLYLHELLVDVVTDEDKAREIVDRHVTPVTCGPENVGRVRDLLLDLDADGLVRRLIGGVTLEEVATGHGLVGTVLEPTEPLLNPLPNAVFTRDSSAWIAEGVVLSPMNRLARRRETDLLRTVYREHPRFDGATVWFGDEPGEHYPATFEGGDVLVVGERAIAIGLSERTTPQGVETLAARLFAAGVVDRILAVDLPKVRAAMHLDTVVTMVDVDAFLVYPSLTPEVRCYQVTPDAGRVRVREADGLVGGLAWATGRDQVRVIEPDLERVDAEREQWNDANNTLAVGPGDVVAYERNVATNDTLRRAGINVRTIPSNELPRGRGGPRCMSCPVVREPVRPVPA